MGKETLVEPRDIEVGKDLIRALARDGVPMERVFWYFVPDGEEWRLVIETPLVATDGPIAVYGRIDSLLESMRPRPPLQLSDITVVASADTLLGERRRSQAKRPDARVLDSPEVTGARVRGAYIYYVHNIVRPHHAGTEASARKAHTES
jgi:hypothetical protein